MNIAHPGVGVEAQDAIQTAIDSGASAVRITNASENGVSSEWIIASPASDPDMDTEDALGAIEGASNQTITVARGVTLSIASGSFLGTHQSMFRWNKKTDCYLVMEPGSRIVMGGVEVFGTYANPVAPYTASEFRHIFKFEGCTRYGISGAGETHLDGAGGDNLYVGPSLDGTRTPCIDGLIHRVYMQRALRNNFSLISARRLRFDRCGFLVARGVAPQAGICIELEGDSRDECTEVVFDQPYFEGNTAADILITMVSMATGHPAISLTIRRPTIERGAWVTPRGIRLVDTVGGVEAEGTVTIEDFTVRDLNLSGVRAELKRETGVRFVLRRGVLSNVGRSLTEKPIALVLSGTTHGGGGLHFEDVVVVDPNDRAAVSLSPDPIVGGEPMVTGNIDVIKTGSAPTATQEISSLTELAFKRSHSRSAKRLTLGRALMLRRGGNRTTFYRATKES